MTRSSGIDTSLGREFPMLNQFVLSATTIRTPWKPEISFIHKDHKDIQLA